VKTGGLDVEEIQHARPEVHAHDSCFGADAGGGERHAQEGKTRKLSGH